MTADVVSAITAHHAHLQSALAERADAVLAAARDNRHHEGAVGELKALLAKDIVPHARAEEDVLYAAASAPTLRPLVRGMIFEHEALLALADRLGKAPTATDAAAIAVAIREIFVGHVRRENDLLLPALADDPAVDLPGLLPVMEQRFGEYRAA